MLPWHITQLWGPQHIGNAICTTNSSPGASLGTVAPGDKLIRTNKPAGQDTDRFRIVGQ